MKDRVKNRVWSLVGFNAVVLIVVLALAYAAGARSGGLSLLDFGALPKIAGFEFLGAAFLVMLASIVLLLQLGSHVVKPTRDLVEFSEKLMAADYEVRASVTPDDFGLIAESWNRAAELLAQLAAIKAAEESLRADVAQLEQVVTQVARGELTARAQIAHPVLTPVIEAFNALADNYARRMERVRAASAEIASAANQALDAAGEMVNGEERQEQATMDATAAVADLAGSTQQVAMHANAATEAARNALE